MKFRRTRFGDDVNDDSEVLAFRDFKRGGGDSLRVTVTANDWYFNRLHNGHNIAKFTEDIHSFGRGKGKMLPAKEMSYRLKYKESTGHVKDL